MEIAKSPTARLQESLRFPSGHTKSSESVVSVQSHMANQTLRKEKLGEVVQSRRNCQEWNGSVSVLPQRCVRKSQSEKEVDEENYFSEITASEISFPVHKSLGIGVCSQLSNEDTQVKTVEGVLEDNNNSVKELNFHQSSTTSGDEMSLRFMCVLLLLKQDISYSQTTFMKPLATQLQPHLAQSTVKITRQAPYVILVVLHKLSN